MLFKKQSFAVFIRSLFSYLLAIGTWSVVSLAHAQVVIEGTRIIYKESERDVTVKLVNSNSQKNAVVQVWLDDGNSSASPEDSQTPFIISPPLAKIPSGRNQMVRVTFVGDKMKPDRETVYWFNMLEIPPKSSEPNVLSFAVRTRIKLFFRPKAILSTPVTHGEKTEWRWKQNEKNAELQVFNDSPFHLSFFELGLMIGDAPMKLNATGMVAPFERITIDVPDVKKIPTAKTTLTLKSVNDYGGVTSSDHTVR